MIFKKPVEKQNRTRSRKIVWFNSPFNKSVTTNVAKRFLNLVDKHFPKTNTLLKIFNRNTVKVSYSCTENMANVIKSHNKKTTMSNEKSVAACNFRNKGGCPLDGLCQTNVIIYKCAVSTKNMTEKVYLGTAEGDFKKRYYNHRKSFKNRLYECDTTLSKYIWEMRVPSYSNITKRCRLCLQEKSEIIKYPRPDELLNKRSELVSKCRHANKYLLCNYKSKD